MNDINNENHESQITTETFLDDKNLQIEINEFHDKLRKLEEISKEIEKESKKHYKDFVILFGIFASMIAFVVVNAEFLGNTKLTVLQYGALISLFLGGITLFALLINDIINNKTTSLYVALIFVMLAVFLFWLSLKFPT